MTPDNLHADLAQHWVVMASMENAPHLMMFASIAPDGTPMVVTWESNTAQDVELAVTAAEFLAKRAKRPTDWVAMAHLAFTPEDSDKSLWRWMHAIPGASLIVKTYVVTADTAEVQRFAVPGLVPTLAEPETMDDDTWGTGLRALFEATQETV